MVQVVTLVVDIFGTERRKKLQGDVSLCLWFNHCWQRKKRAGVW